MISIIVTKYSNTTTSQIFNYEQITISDLKERKLVLIEKY
jgi:hypothetical protein